MGQGYTRSDGANSIADGNVVDAADLDGEFDALLAAFVAATGHTHDGSGAEGGAITVVGPAQDFVGGSGDFSPKADSTYDLGKTATRWATGYIDDLVLTTALPITEGGSGATSAGAARTAFGVVIGTDVQAWDTILDGTTASYTTAEETKLSNIETAADVTDTVNVVAALTAGTNVTISSGGVIASTDTNTTYTVGDGGLTQNNFTNDDHTKLNNVEASADVTDATNVTAAGALMDSEVANLADVKAFDTADYATAAQGVLAAAAAPLASPTFTGVPAAPTATAGTDTTQVATTAFVRDEIPNQLNATGSAPLYGCRAWVNFDGSGTIRASGNVASVTRNNTGDFSITFTTAMPDADYSAVLTASNDQSNSTVVLIDNSNVPTATVLRINCKNAANGGSLSPSFVMVSVFR